MTFEDLSPPVEINVMQVELLPRVGARNGMFWRKILWLTYKSDGENF